MQVEGGDLERVRELLDADSLPYSPTPGGPSTTHAAASYGYDDILLLIIQRYPDEVDAETTKSQGRKTPLAAAIMSERKSTVSLLIREVRTIQFMNL